MYIRVVLLCTLLLSPALYAIPINLSSQQLITSSGQLFHFSFTGLPTEGLNGQFNITLNGDFSGANSESSVSNLDVALGILDIGNGNLLNGIITNSISGLTLNSYTRQIFESDDIEQTWVFDLSASLLTTVLADGNLNIVVKNDNGVDPLARRNPDFVRVGFHYQSLETLVRESSGFWLFVLGVSALFFLRFHPTAARNAD